MMEQPIIFIGATNMRYTTRLNKETKLWEIVMDEGYPSESIYNEYDMFEAADLVCFCLNKEEGNE